VNILFQKSYQRAFGTYPLTGETCVAATLAALEVGFRAIDTAQMYGNEADVGRALAATSVPREDLCIVTKVHPDNFSEELFLPSVERSLRDLGLSYVDVLLLHWPPVGGDIAPSIALLQTARNSGLARQIGVSNYNARMMRRAAQLSDHPLITNQVEFHPLLDQSALLAAAAETGIPLSSYSSIARGKIFDFPVLAEIGAGYGKSAGQIALHWILQKGVSLSTMSTKPENLRQNFDIIDFTLSSVDMARIDALNETGYRVVGSNIKWAPEWD
jgi:2,5-diketo-D-gluconate reductase B